MRPLPLLLLVALLPQVAADLGAGDPAYAVHAAPTTLPGHDSAGEPTLGIPWNTDSVFFQAFTWTFRVTFGDDGTATWEDVTPLTSRQNFDPMVHADPDTGRVWAGGLLGPCSGMAFSDDDGASWTPTGNMCSGVQFDHQSIGSGPFAVTAESLRLFPHATYYCAQLGLTACATSRDGGLTWGPFTEVLPPCGGIHGHIRVSRATGLAAVPDGSCGGVAGFGYTTDDGATWNSRTVDVAPTERAFDPSLQFSRPSGWLYFGQAGDTGAHVALSKDEGLTWEPLGGGHGEEVRWLDVGRLHDPPVVHAMFADVQAGDDDRAAFSFLGLEERAGGYGDIHQCADGQETMVWHAYVAVTYDAGRTWDVRRVTDDPVQVGGIFDGGFDPTQDGSCRNLLDFKDMDLDSAGRIHVALADGCVRACAETGEPGSDGWRTAHATIVRQVGGRGLFSAHDVEAPTDGGEVPADAADEDAPALVPAVALAVLLALAWARRS